MLNRLLQIAHFSVGTCFLQTLQTGVLFGFFATGSSSSELSSRATKLSSFFAVRARGEPFRGDGLLMGLDIHWVNATELFRRPAPPRPVESRIRHGRKVFAAVVMGGSCSALDEASSVSLLSRGFLALGAFVGELRRFGGMVALCLRRPRFPLQCSPWGLCRRFELACCGLGPVVLRVFLTAQEPASSSCKAALTLDFNNPTPRALCASYCGNRTAEEPCVPAPQQTATRTKLFIAVRLPR